MDDMQRNSPLPSDPFDQQLARLTGLPNGANTSPTVVQTVDFYGNSTTWISQVVKTDEGEYAFLTVVKADAAAARFVVPPRVLSLMDRQRATTTTIVRRRHGRRLAAERKAAGIMPGFMKPKTTEQDDEQQPVAPRAVSRAIRAANRKRRKVGRKK
jgi:hypothetical protein